MFTDLRSKKVILVAHCILNQNAKIDRCAYYPGVMREVTQYLLDAGVGLLQMPCPEMLTLGLDRQVDNGISTTVESEDDRVALRMNEHDGWNVCQKIAGDLVYQIQEYQHHGFEVLGVLGINGSPTCGVEYRWGKGHEEEGHGVLIQVLVDELQKRNAKLSMRGIKAREPESALKALLTLFQQKSGG